MFMVERGGCHFVTKSRNIALNGGKIALIIDSKNEDISGINMADDGTGAGIRIPSVMIGNRDGKILKNFFKEASGELRKEIVLNLEFNAPKKTNDVKVELWYTHSDRKTLNFVNSLGTLMKPIIDDIEFVPNFVTYSCPDCTKEFKKENCLSNGAFCATSHKNADN